MSTITIIGSDASGKIVAQEGVTDSRMANQIADYWRGSGFEVEITDQPFATSAESTGQLGREAPQ